MILEKLSVLTGQSIPQLLNFAKTAEWKYKIFDIKKRKGGTRRIEQPSKAVKILQRWVSKVVFSKYPIHSNAMGYRKDISIKNNAECHVAYKYTLRLDFKDFFWSFKKASIQIFLQNNLHIVGLTPDDIEFGAGLDKVTV